LIFHNYTVFCAAGLGGYNAFTTRKRDSEGQYDESLAIDRSHGYSCDPALSIPGADRALHDIEAAMGAILTMPFVDSKRVIIGGQSRGGILSVIYAGQHPEQVKGVINFVGGWLGYNCKTVSTVNQELFKRGAHYPGESIWHYGDWDHIYPLFHSRENFAAFQAAGGKGVFHAFKRNYVSSRSAIIWIKAS
jgi:dienelactone hydrolase